MSFTKVIVTFFGTGLISKKMPGTIGSIAATILCIMYHSPLIPLLLFLIGLIFCHIYIKKLNYVDIDPKYIVIDEVFGIYLGAFVLDIFQQLTILNLIINLFFFRVFDIFKPFPIKNIEKLCKKYKQTAAIGIMIDDAFASIIGTFIQVYINKICF